MFHLGLSSPSSESYVRVKGTRVVAPGPLGIGEVDLAACANEEIAEAVGAAFAAAPRNLRSAVFLRPESAAVLLMNCAVRDGEVPTDLRDLLREWAALDHQCTDVAFVALRAFVQSALDAADRL